MSVEQKLSRRRLLRAAFWVAAGLSLAGAGGLVLDYVWPRDGAPRRLIGAGDVADYQQGGPPRFFVTDRFWGVHLDPADEAPNGGGGGDGFLP